MKKEDYALEFAKQGCRIVPQGRNKKGIDGWQELATSNPATIKRWAKQYPRHNFAVVTGKTSGLIVLDIDVKNGQQGRESLQRLKEELGEESFATLLVRTPSTGEHDYFAYPENAEFVASGNLPGYPGIEIKADASTEDGHGQLITLPGSLYDTGAEYVLIEDKPLKSVPASLLALMEKPMSLAGNEIGERIELPETIPAGERDVTLFRIGCALRAYGYEEPEILTLLRVTNQRCEDPPNNRRPTDTVLREKARAICATYRAGELPGYIDKVAQKLAKGQESIDKAREKLVFLTVKNVFAYPSPEYLIEGLLIKNTVVVLGGESGLGKSLVALTLIQSVLDGFPVWGRYEVGAKGGVVLLDEETPESMLKERLEAMRFSEEHPFNILHFSGFRLDVEADSQALLQQLDTLEPRPVLLIFDSFVRFHNKQEDSSTEMAQVMGSLRKIANAGYTVLVLHHHNKKADSPLSHRLRGSCDIPAGVDVEYAITRAKGEEGVLVLQSVKTRVKPFAPIKVQIEEDESGRLEVSCLGHEVSERYKREQAVRDCLKESPKTMKELVESTGIARESLRNLLKTMGDVDAERPEGANKPYVYKLVTVLPT